MIIILWFVVGLYAALVNHERVERIYGSNNVGNFFQGLLTIILGPVGLVLVMCHGGRLDFWKQ